MHIKENIVLMVTIPGKLKIKLAKFPPEIRHSIVVLVPHVMAIITFFAGAIFLFSGAIPAVDSRLLFLKRYVSLPVLELSNFATSLIGVILLFLARGLQRHLDAAYIFSVALLVMGIIFSLLKGLAYQQAIILTIILCALIPTRAYFFRKAMIFKEPFTLGWEIAIAIIMVCFIFLGFIVYRNIEYSQMLWWRFSFDANVSRFLRAAVASSCLAIFIALYKLSQAAPIKDTLPSKADMETAHIIIVQSKMAMVNFVLLGDKSLLFSDSRKTFIMYRKHGRSMVSLGGPFGLEEEWMDIIWDFRNLAKNHDCRPVFSAIKAEHIYYYLDLGLSLIKMGEEAIIPLDMFSMEGSNRRSFRKEMRHIKSEGASFKVIPCDKVSLILKELETISDAWLAKKNTREKKFSLGFFNEDYLKHFPIGVVRKGEKIVAFANILAGAEKEELTVDLIRYLPGEAPRDVMDYLFINLMLWGKQEGYKVFNLGMAPLSGLDRYPLELLWNRIGAFIFHRAEYFYNFQGVRAYKNKFNPTWKPRYLAFSGRLSLPKVLADTAALSSGGVKGIFLK
jgi:phosphatidylglycerol lysyltransferase